MAKRVSQYRVVPLLTVFALLSFVACQALACLLPASVEERKQSAHCPNDATPETSPNACQKNLATDPSTNPSSAATIKMAIPDIANRHLPWYEHPSFHPISGTFFPSNDLASTRAADLYLLSHALRI
jgi:hypothetical protein